ncbi:MULTISPECIES: hypothetical protein [Streptomycetaceae]|uniref:Uncharacterized protein n=1 Tax=Streptantibioticus cattleyicolor (strain ATCC 35852 / DSM 46488 / JCM 4925 / NBRC 14057 / NRRL 8057) TaxID=1003195 RepID=F8JXK0_STREN|nr:MULTISPECIES: hypothetical protein [Streptomycetaceae]AEW95890.1 hypothetical protein SCATT_35190 [Streptantibioticus cattleyicolor NRRL 8057 = DSM 46488]MYS60428.1 hypothetical protein [Streptomyces sp. SID5468]CCB76226.1 conserved exported protein of unknown function [Streptantibioticus cattleyicolor NRRL 8057 = DSM 46488]
MLITISAVVLFGVFLAFLLRSRSLGFGGAFVAVMFGFFLASTGAAGPITRLTTDVAHTLASLGH